MNIIVYENGLRAHACEEILYSSRSAAEFDEVIILPIPSSRDGVHVSGTELLLCEVLEQIKRGSLVVGYGLARGYVSELVSRGITVWDGAEDEGFLLENARLTAEATLDILHIEGRRALSELSVGIVGYGRIGAELCRLLLFFGARVRVYTSRLSVRLELSELGIDTALSIEGADTDGIDVLINTAPHPIFDFTLSVMPPRIIELASGSNFAASLSVERYPSLPARAFPETAGRVWGDSVVRWLTERRKSDG